MKRHFYFVFIIALALMCSSILLSCSGDKKCVHSTEVVINTTSEPTCDADGSRDCIVKCVKCGEVIEKVTQSISKLNHTATTEIKENRINPTCTKSGSYDSVTICLDCGTEVKREKITTSPIGHNESDEIKENYTAPTCLKDGEYDKTTYCLKCGDTLSTVHVKIDKNDSHSITTDVGYAPTKTDDGLTYGSHCDVCGTVIKPQYIIPAELQGTEIYSELFTLESDTLNLSVSSDVNEISFSDSVLKNKSTSIIVSYDKYGLSVLPIGTAPLNLGENIFYLIVKDKDSNVKLYTAYVYRRSVFTVNFNSNGGGPIESVTVEEGTVITPPIPERDNYTFEGWDYDFTKPISNNVEANAIWLPIYSSYIVEIYHENIEKNGYDLVSSNTFEEKCGATVSVDPEEYAHFVFVGEESTTEGTVDKDGTLTIKLYYTRKTYTVINSSDLGDVIGLGTYVYGSEITLEVSANKGYYFLGWYDGEIFITNKTTYKFKVDRDIVARWDITSYPITYYDGGRKLTVSLDKYTVLDGEVTLPRAEKSHYVFIGWYDNPHFTGLQIKTFDSSCGGELVFYARFVERNYIINYNLANGENNIKNPSSYNVSTILPITLHEPTKDGYTFTGWFTDIYLTDQITEINRLVGDIELYAGWIKNGIENEVPPGTPEHKIIYMYGDEEIAHYPSVYFEGYTTDLFDYYVEHYTFLGWYTDKNLSDNSKISRINQNMTGTVTLYAKLQPIPYTIVYETNGGEIVGEYCQIYNATSAFPIALPTVEKAGYTFSGWYRDPEFTNPIIEITEPLGNLKLYAFYGKEAEGEAPQPGQKFKITYKHGDKTLTLEPNYYNYGSITILPTPEIEGYVFEGWYTSPTFEESTRIMFIHEAQSGDIKLYAKITPKTT